MSASTLRPPTPVPTIAENPHWIRLLDLAASTHPGALRGRPDELAVVYSETIGALERQDLPLFVAAPTFSLLVSRRSVPVLRR